MSEKLKIDLQQQIQSLYGPLEAANIALFKSKSVKDERIVHALEEQMNTLVDKLIELEATEAQP